jgi:hypothetical protein
MALYVSLNIDDQIGSALELAGHNQSHDVLQRSEGLSATADENAEVLSPYI